jgi:hypothetical protein
MSRVSSLPEPERYRLIELLDPESVTHFEFWLSKPPFARSDWSSEEALRAALPSFGTCLTGWPGMWIMDRDYFPVGLSQEEYDFLKLLEENAGLSVGQLVSKCAISADTVRKLAEKQIILLREGPHYPNV